MVDEEDEEEEEEEEEEPAEGIIARGRAAAARRNHDNAVISNAIAAEAAALVNGNAEEGKDEVNAIIHVDQPCLAVSESLCVVSFSCLSIWSLKKSQPTRQVPPHSVFHGVPGFSLFVFSLSLLSGFLNVLFSLAFSRSPTLYLAQRNCMQPSLTLSPPPSLSLFIFLPQFVLPLLLCPACLPLWECDLEHQLARERWRDGWMEGWRGHWAWLWPGGVLQHWGCMLRRAGRPLQRGTKAVISGRQERGRRAHAPGLMN